jgi:hypothetical protein
MKNPYKVPLHVLVFHGDGIPDDQSLIDLQGDIQENGLKVPVLIDRTTNTVLDGSRRIRAMINLGWTHCLVYGVETFDEGVQYLDKVRKNPRLPAGLSVTTGRIWRFYCDFQNLIDLRQKQLKNRRIGVSRDVHLERLAPSRRLLAEAIGTSEGQMVALISTYKTAQFHENPDIRAFAAGLTEELDQGKITCYSARHRLQKALHEKPEGSIATASAQRETLGMIISQLNGVARGIAAFNGISDGLSAEELAEYVNSLRKPLSVIRSHSNQIQKRINTG